MSHNDDSRGFKMASIAAFLALTVAILLLLRQHSLFATGPVGWTVQGLAVVLMVWARFTLKWRSFHPGADPTEGELVTSGPYRFIRHPIYAAIFYFVAAGVAYHISPVNGLLVALTLLGIAIRIVSEERLLIRQYPEYREYMTRTRRIIPFIL